jgi:hypothetical protein
MLSASILPVKLCGTSIFSTMSYGGPKDSSLLELDGQVVKTITRSASKMLFNSR